MTIKEAIYNHITADPQLASFVSSRVFDSSASEKTSGNYIVYKGLRTTPIYNLRQFHKPQVEFSVWSVNQHRAEQIGWILYRLLDGFSGILGGGVMVKSITGVIEPFVIRDTCGLFRCAFDMKIVYRDD